MITNTPPTVTTALQSNCHRNSQSLDVMLYAMRLGPVILLGFNRARRHVDWEPVQPLALYRAITNTTKPLLSTVSALTIGASSGRTDMVYGGYVNATVMYHAVENGDIYAGVQFMPMSDANFSGAGREGRLNLGGQLYFTIGINWPFSNFEV